MRKILIVIVVAVIIFLCLFTAWYTGVKNENQEIANFNYEYEQYVDKEITGVDLTTVIYKAIDNNEKNEISKNESGAYIDDDENYVEVYINITKDIDEEDENAEEKNLAYPMEAFDEVGVTSFTSLYGSAYFKCVSTEYHDNGKISKLIFEIVG